jgi:hypothetical protein
MLYKLFIVHNNNIRYHEGNVLSLPKVQSQTESYVGLTRKERLTE